MKYLDALKRKSMRKFSGRWMHSIGIKYKNEANKALEGRRLLVTISAISALRASTDRAKQPSPSA
jgi:hypothetical protein